MVRRLVAVVVVVVLAAVAGTSAAQPGNTPLTTPPTYAPPAGPVPGERSPGIATALSLGGTIASIGMLSMDDPSGDSSMQTVGMLGLFLAPSFGHWYAGKLWTAGMTMRLAGTGATVIGAVMLFSCIDSDTDCAAEPGAFLVWGGVGTFVAGGVYDIATASRSAHQHNERLRARASASWAVMPIVAPDRTGLAISGRF